RFPAATLFLASAIAAFAFPATAAPKSLEAGVQARRRTAQALAGKGQWRAAFLTLAAARDQINAERRKAFSPPRRPMPPALRDEAKALSVWVASKNKGRKPGEPVPAAIMSEYRRRQTALRQKIAKLGPPKQSA